jgi:hypothetical protein
MYLTHTVTSEIVPRSVLLNVLAVSLELLAEIFAGVLSFTYTFVGLVTVPTTEFAVGYNVVVAACAVFGAYHP